MKKILLFLLVVLVFGCNDERSVTNNNDTLNVDTKDVAYETAKQIFYSLPSPVETAMIIEKTKVKFNGDIILPASKADFFETSSEQSVILGIYSADLSYLTMFDQNQSTVEYIAACKKLTEKLGLLEVIPDSIITSIQDKLRNKEEVMNIISEQFMEINAYLEENNQTVNISLVVYGGWIEGFYLSAKLVDNDISKNPDLVQMICDQIFSLEDLITLLDLYKNNSEVNKYISNLSELKIFLEKFEKDKTQNNFNILKDEIIKIRNIATNTK
jgi:hypothetical protein